MFKLNISYKGKALKLETESEDFIRSKIGDKLAGAEIDSKLEGYELEITGTSDEAGFPGVKGHTGGYLRGALLKKGDKGNRNKKKGLRLRKSIRGEEVSEKTTQINMKVLKEGKTKFQDFLGKTETEESQK